VSMELDELDKKAASVFDGYLVRKDLVRKYSRQYPVPTYVVEFLLGRYCASVNESEIAEGLQIVEKQLKDRTVRTGEEELFKARARGPARSGSSTSSAHGSTPRTIATSPSCRA
jgi:ATP-dependent Lon protease